MRLLIVEDDKELAQRIESACISEGLNCHKAETGVEALEMVQLYDYAVIVLDILLPDMCGFDIISRLRAINNTTPILILSGLISIEDKVKSFTIGADDYVTKPFSKQELFARIHAIIRRSSGLASPEIKIGPMTLNVLQRKVYIYDTDLTLTNKEYAILELLAMKRGSVLAKEVFLNHIYGGMDEPEGKIIDVFICKLRKKIADMTGGINLIETVWGRGYIIREDNENSAKKIQPINNLSSKANFSDTQHTNVTNTSSEQISKAG